MEGLGLIAVAALWAAMFSHFVLNLLMQGGSLTSSRRMICSCPPSLLGPARLLQLSLSAMLLVVFVVDERREGLLLWPTWGAACIVLVCCARAQWPIPR